MTDQLPESGFPSGVGTPSVTMLVLLLLHAGLCVVLLDGRESGTASAAIAESQEQLVRGAGSAIGASASQGIADLRAATAARAATPEELLTRLLQNGKWRGAAVLDARTRALVAARGEPVSVASLPASVTSTIVTPVVGADGALRMVVAEALPGARLLVAARGGRLPDSTIGGDPREALLLTTSTGQVIDSRGTPPAPADTDVNRLVELASAAAAAGEQGNLTGRTAAGPDGAEQPTVVYSPVSSAQVDGTLGLAVVSVVRAPVTVAGPGGNGIVPAIALGCVAVFGHLLLRRVLVDPIRRLRADALFIAEGRLMTTRVHRARTREVDRIAAAFEHCRSELGGTPARPGRTRRAGMATWLATGLTAGAVLAWSAGVLSSVGSRDVTVPDAVVTSAGNQTTAATEALRRSLNDGLADLTSFAALTDGRADVRSSLDELIAGQSRYRSVYLADRSGGATSVVGRPPLRTAEPLPAEPGIRLREGNAPVPALFAHAPLPDGQALVGEFDLDHIGRLLGRAPGSVRLVDNGLRTIAATDGFVAFSDLDAELRDSATEAGKGKPVARTQEGTDGRAVIVSAPLRGGASGRLEWTVVAEQPVTDLALPGSELRRNAIVAALVAALLALLLFGWQYLLLIRPLRRVAAAADEIAAGRYGSVIYPQRQDQIGTIASCLEICRQALTDGVRRLGGARRPSGAATDATELIAAVPAAPRRGGHGQAPRQARRPGPARVRRGR